MTFSSATVQERLAALVEERKHVIEDDDRGVGKDRSKGAKGGAGIKVDAEDMVAKEAQRLEVMKRRQERELSQMVAYELLRKQMQVSFPASCMLTSSQAYPANNSSKRSLPALMQPLVLYTTASIFQRVVRTAGG